MSFIKSTIKVSVRSLNPLLIISKTFRSSLSLEHFLLADWHVLFAWLIFYYNYVDCFVRLISSKAQKKNKKKQKQQQDILSY